MNPIQGNDSSKVNREFIKYQNFKIINIYHIINQNQIQQNLTTEKTLNNKLSLYRVIHFTDFLLNPMRRLLLHKINSACHLVVFWVKHIGLGFVLYSKTVLNSEFPQSIIIPLFLNFEYWAKMNYQPLPTCQTQNRPLTTLTIVVWHFQFELTLIIKDISRLWTKPVKTVLLSIVCDSMIPVHCIEPGTLFYTYVWRT